MLCRALKPLRVGERIVPIGGVECLDVDASVLKKLLDKGAITPASGPPLSEIPLWENRAPQLAKIGILDTDQFLEANSDRLAGYLDIESGTIEAWKKELLRWLVGRNIDGHQD